MTDTPNVDEGGVGAPLEWATLESVEPAGELDSALGRVKRGWPGARKVLGPARRLIGWEMLIVLALFPFGSAWSAVVDLIERIEYHYPITSRRIPAIEKPWVAILFALLLQLIQLVPAALVGYLLTRSGEGLSAIHLDRPRLRTDFALLLPIFILVQWLPQGLGIHMLKWVHLTGYYLRSSPVRVSSAALTVALASASVVAGILEEVVVLGYLVRRLEQRGFGLLAIVVIDVAVRVSYHLYYGWNAVPIFLWALATVVVYLRIRRLLPFILCHIAYHLAIPLRVFYGGTYHVLLYLTIATTAVMTLAWARWSPPSVLAAGPEAPPGQ